MCSAHPASRPRPDRGSVGLGTGVAEEGVEGVTGAGVGVGEGETGGQTDLPRRLNGFPAWVDVRATFRRGPILDRYSGPVFNFRVSFVCTCGRKPSDHGRPCLSRVPDRL